MRRRRTLLLAAAAVTTALLTAGGTTATRAATPPPAWTTYDRPAQYAVVVDQHVPVQMSDGVVLNAEIRRPNAPGKFPVIVTITPYNGTNGAINVTNDYLVQRGYVQVIVDARGTGESQGTWDAFGTREQRDGYEIVEWAAAQKWSNGIVGMWGASYMAISQLFTAAQQPPHLKAIFPIVPMSDSYRDMVFPGGQANTGFIPLWLVLVSGAALIPPDYALDGNPADLARALGELGQHALNFPGFDANRELQAMAGDTAYDGPFWKTSSPLEVVDNIRVPTFVVGGEHDIFQRGEPLIYERLKGHVPTRLLIGPWTHTDGSSGKGLPAGGVPSLDSIALRWFDQYLKGISTNIGAIPKVTQYVLGAGQWETRTDWPDPSLTPSRLYLGPANTLGAAPPTPSAPDTFLQNPVSGVCTQSTSQWTAGLLAAVPCTTNNRLDEATSGVSYTTAPLTHALQFDGPLFADVWVSTTARDAVATVRVTDVAPDGTSTELTDGWLAASFRATDAARSRYVAGQLMQPWHPFTQSSVLPVPAGQPVELPIEIFPTDAVIPAGHSLRLYVGPNDFPHAVPPVSQLAAELGGVVQVLHDPQHPSYLELPEVGTCTTPCKPLPVPNLIRG
ncbi:MAG TPA: CocE/NonD family hydrolase [Gaiellaceae bacterium]|nr:CocE/NonD family hydrolase [Gaiellaceae bacterium]